MIHTCHLSSQKAEARGSQVGGCLVIFAKPCLKKTKLIIKETESNTVLTGRALEITLKARKQKTKGSTMFFFESNWQEANG
jgi:hypothetical protein